MKVQFYYPCTKRERDKMIKNIKARYGDVLKRASRTQEHRATEYPCPHLNRTFVVFDPGYPAWAHTDCADDCERPYERKADA